MKFYIIFPLCLLECLHLFAQKDTMHNKQIFALPVFANAKETGFAYGFGGMATFNLSKSQQITKESQFLLATINTTKNQFYAGLTAKVYFPKTITL